MRRFRPSEPAKRPCKSSPHSDEKKPPEGGSFSGPGSKPPGTSTEELLLDSVFSGFNSLLGSVSSRSHSAGSRSHSTGGSGNSARSSGNSARSGSHRAGSDFHRSGCWCRCGCSHGCGCWRRSRLFFFATSCQGGGSNHGCQYESFVHFKIPDELKDNFRKLPTLETRLKVLQNALTCIDRARRLELTLLSLAL